MSSEAIRAAETALSNAEAALRKFDTPLATFKATLDRAVASKNKRFIESAEADYVNRKQQDSSDRKLYLGAVSSAQNRLAAARAAGSGPGPTTVTTPDTAPYSPPQPEVQASPPDPPQPPAPPVYTGVLAAPIDTVVFVDEPFSENFYADVLFQDFGGQELLSIARSDTVNGQSVVYQPFKDLGIINEQYSPNKLLSIQETSDRFFANFLIKLNGKIPVVGNGPSGSNVYLEEGETGSVIIEFINIETNEQIEIQILNAGIIEDIGI
jgi:hypothetical protein